MKKRYSEEQIIKVIKRQEAGVRGDDLCRELGIYSATFYYLRDKYAVSEMNELKRLKALERDLKK